MTERFRPQFFEVPDTDDPAALSDIGEELCRLHRGVNWWIGDLARKVARKPDLLHQTFAEWFSPGQIARCKAVAEAYPHQEDRNILATWTQHMQVAGKPDRIELVAAMVGQTSDESRKEQTETNRQRWLLAVDVNYFLHRFWYSGAGVEAAVGVSEWVERTVERLKEKGLTDAVCCFDHPINHRKVLTEEWVDKYKDRPKKDPELSQQITLVRELLAKLNFTCASVEGMEADDCMASYAHQFKGRVTLLTQDKDLRQCLSANTNMLMDVEWEENETSGDMLPKYKWLSAKTHTEETGIRPDQWTDYQTICGDNVDGIKGAIGIGAKGAADLIKMFDTVEMAIQAAKDDDGRIKPKKRESLIDLDSKVEVMRALVTLKTDVQIPGNTRL